MIDGEGSPAKERVLALEGELDVGTATDAHKRLPELGLPHGGRLVVDLSEVAFMDSNGIRFLLQAREHARRCGATYVVVRGPDEVMRVLELVGLDEQLDIVTPAQSAAISAASPASPAPTPAQSAAMPVR